MYIRMHIVRYLLVSGQIDSNKIDRSSLFSKMKQQRVTRWYGNAINIPKQWVLFLACQFDDWAQRTYWPVVRFASWGLQQCLGQPCNARKERSICNDLQTLIRAVREHCCNPQLYNSFLGFSRLLHSMFLDGTPYVAVLWSHPNYVWILMYCHAMPTHDVLLQHCRKLLLQVSTRRCISWSSMYC